jgi:hypothetical protein
MFSQSFLVQGQELAGGPDRLLRLGQGGEVSHGASLVRVPASFQGRDGHSRMHTLASHQRYTPLTAFL